MYSRLWQFIISGLLVFFLCLLAYQQYFNKASDKTNELLTTQIEALSNSNLQSQAKTSEYYGLLRAQIALNEYNKLVIEQPKGCNCGPIIDQYTESKQSQWCTMFASWVTKKAGSPFEYGLSKTWKIENSRALTHYLQKTGTFYTRDEIVQKNINPQIGDFVIFYRGNYEESLGHTDVIVKLGDKPGSADLVGGNVNDRVDYRTNFQYIDYYGFLGFGRPEK